MKKIISPNKSINKRTLIKTMVCSFLIANMHVIPTPAVYTFNKIVETGDFLPDIRGAFYSVERQPKISKGNILIYASGGLGGDGLYLYSIKQKRFIEKVTVDDLNVQEVLSWSVLDGDKFVFTGCEIHGGACFVYSVTDGKVNRELNMNTPIPGSAGFFHEVITASLDGDDIGIIGFGDYHVNPQELGIYILRNGNLIKIADNKTQIPGSTSTFTYFNRLLLNQGRVIFYGGNEEAANEAIYEYRDGDIIKLVDFSTTIPGRTNTFASFGSAAIDGDNLVFFGTDSNHGDDLGIYHYKNGNLNLVFDTNTPLPNAISNIEITDFGISLHKDKIIFNASGFNISDALFVTTINGDVSKIIDNNDTLEGREIRWLSYLTNHSIYDDDVVVWVQFWNGDQAVYLAQPLLVNSDIINYTFDTITRVLDGNDFVENPTNIAISTDWSFELKGEGAFAGSDGNILNAVVHHLRNRGVSGLTGDHAVSLEVDVDIASSSFWYGGLFFDPSITSIKDDGQIYLTADVMSPHNTDYLLALESSPNNYLAFFGIGNGDWQEIGGSLLTGVEVGHFDRDGPFKIVIAFRNAQSSWGERGRLLVDNIQLTFIPDDLEAEEFIAYNDLSWGIGQINENITLYTTMDGFGVPPEGDVGILVDYSTGLNTPVTLSVSGGNWNGGSHTTQGSLSEIGTDGFEVFNDKLDATGVVSYGQSDLKLTFEGLNACMFYDLTLFGNRDRSDYTNRLTMYTLQGVNSFQNESSVGAAFLGAEDPSTIIANGYNTLDGYLARFTKIDPGNDGQFEVVVSGGGFLELSNHYVNALRLQGYKRSVSSNLDAEVLFTSTSSNASDGVAGENAIDGDLCTSWIGCPEATNWGILVFYKKTFELSEIQLSFGEDSLTDVDVLVSENLGQWQTLEATVLDEPMPMRYLWILFTEDASGKIPEVREIAVY